YRDVHRCADAVDCDSIDARRGRRKGHAPRGHWRGDRGGGRGGAYADEMKTPVIAVLIFMAISVKAAVGVDAKIDALFRDFDHPNAPGASVMVVHNGKSIFAK